MMMTKPIPPVVALVGRELGVLEEEALDLVLALVLGLALGLDLAPDLALALDLALVLVTQVREVEDHRFVWTFN